MSDYLRVARKYWRSIAAITLLAVLGAGAFSWLTKPTYTATTTVFLSVKSVRTTSELSSGSAFAENQVQSFTKVARAPIVLQPVIDELDLKATPEVLAGKITATVPANTATIDLAVVDGDPAQASRIANAVGDHVVSTVKQLSPPDVDGSPTVEATIIRPAATPLSPTTPKVAQNLALGLALGLLLGAGQGVLRSVMNTLVISGRDLEHVTDRPVLGAIMAEATQESDPLAKPGSIRAEAYRRLRTNLQFLGIEEGRRAIVVTSAVKGEGKTTTAINVASALAAAGDRVLLIDADLRSRSIAGRLGLDPAMGLTSALIGQASAPELVQRPSEGGFDVLTSGPIPPNPSELLGFDAMKNLLHVATQKYDVVIIDAPPLLPVTDAVVLSHLASGALVVVGCRDVHRGEVAGALASLDQANARTLGIVLNKVQPENRSYGYGYGYGYGYAYGYGNGEPAKATKKAARRAARPQGETPQAAQPVRWLND